MIYDLMLRLMNCDYRSGSTEKKKNNEENKRLRDVHDVKTITKQNLTEGLFYMG